MPWSGPWLQSQQFDAEAIGTLTAVVAGTRIIAPNVIGWLVELSGHPILLLRLCVLLTTLFFTPLLFFQLSFAMMIIVLGGYSFFWNSIVSQLEVITRDHLGQRVHHYAWIRLWGSVGFIVMVIFTGWWLEKHSIASMPIIAMLLFIVMMIAVFQVPAPSYSLAEHSNVSLKHQLQQPTTFLLFLLSFLIQLSHGPYYTFYSIYLQQHGYARPLIGQLWALGVVSEVAMFMLMPILIQRVRLSDLLLLSLLLTALRWLMNAWLVDSLGAMIIAQLLHSASFGLYHSVAIHLIYQYFPGRLQGHGQALYSALGFGAGGAIGSLLSGYIWIRLGGSATWLLASLCCLSALWIGCYWRRYANDINL